MNNIPGPVWSLWMFKYKKNSTYLQYSECRRGRKFSMKQNVDVNSKNVIYRYICKKRLLHYCCLFSIWTARNMHDFQQYFSRTSRTFSFNFQDFPGPGISRKKSRTLQEAWEPWHILFHWEPKPDLFIPKSDAFMYVTVPQYINAVWLDWIEQGLTSPPTQYRLSGRQFYRSKDPTNVSSTFK